MFLPSFNQTWKMGVSVSFVVFITACNNRCYAQNAYSWTDDFSSYSEGSLAQPRWLPGSIDLAIKNGAYWFDGRMDSFSLADGLPACRQVELEATITILEPSPADTWRIGGIAIYQNNNNFWHFALVESPSDKNKSHFLELSEKLDNHWLAQSNLSQTLSENMNYNWQYNQPYRLQLVMTDTGIAGTLLDLSGSVLARCAYTFNNKAVTSGLPALHVSQLQAAFDDVTAKGTQPLPPAPKPQFPPFAVKSWDGITQPPSGFFHVENMNDKWWCITPDGKWFYAVGTDHCNYNGHWCEKLGYNPYGRNNQQKYPSVDDWAKETVQRLTSWGFNLVAAGHSEQLRHQGLAHTLWLGVGVEFSSISDIVPKVHWTGVPNVFDPRFAAFCKIRARQILTDYVDDPWVFGIFIDNELEWFGKNYGLGGVFDEAMKKGPDHTAKIALVKMLQSKYSDIKHLNTAWKTTFENFDSILNIDRIDAPAFDNALAEDKLQYLSLVADTYFAVTTAAIREVDPHHMILGCRFAGDAPQPCWQAAGKYCDIVSVNQYPRINIENRRLPAAIADLVKFHKWCGRPLMLTEWSFPALDSGLPCLHGAGMRVQTQQQRAKAFEIYQSTLFRLPFMVGSDFFMWVDEPALGISSTFPEDSNYGLVNEDNKPYEALTATAACLNPRVYEIHSQPYDPNRYDLSDEQPRPVSCQSGLPWPKNTSNQSLRFPVIVSNTGNQTISNRFVSLTLEQLAPDFDWSPIPPDAICLKTAQDRDLLWQLDDFDGKLDRQDEICLSVSSLKPLENQQFFLYINRPSNLPPTTAAIDYTHLDNGFRIANDYIRLEKTEPDGDFIDAFYYQDVLLGRYNPVVWQQNRGQNFWTHADRFIDAQISRGPLRILLHLTDAGGVPAAPNAVPLAFQVEHRLAIYPDQPWFEARFVRLTNQSAQPLQLHGAFFYLMSAIAGDNKDDILLPRVPNYYLGNFNLWHDPTGYEYGALAPEEGNLLVRFYVNEQGGQHPDAQLHFSPPLMIAPEENVAAFDSPALAVFGLQQEPQSELPMALWERINQQFSLAMHFFPAEYPDTRATAK